MTATAEFFVEGMHCASCGLLIDDTVEDLAGVECSITDARRGRTRVDYDPDRVTPDAIAAAIGDAGYPASPAPGAG